MFLLKSPLGLQNLARMVFFKCTCANFPAKSFQSFPFSSEIKYKILGVVFGPLWSGPHLPLQLDFFTHRLFCLMLPWELHYFWPFLGIHYFIHLSAPSPLWMPTFIPFSKQFKFRILKPSLNFLVESAFIFGYRDFKYSSYSTFHSR